MRKLSSKMVPVLIGSMCLLGMSGCSGDTAGTTAASATAGSDYSKEESSTAEKETVSFDKLTEHFGTSEVPAFTAMTNWVIDNENDTFFLAKDGKIYRENGDGIKLYANLPGAKDFAVDGYTSWKSLLVKMEDGRVAYVPEAEFTGEDPRSADDFIYFTMPENYVWTDADKMVYFEEDGKLMKSPVTDMSKKTPVTIGFPVKDGELNTTVPVDYQQYSFGRDSCVLVDDNLIYEIGQVRADLVPDDYTYSGVISEWEDYENHTAASSNIKEPIRKIDSDYYLPIALCDECFYTAKGMIPYSYPENVTFDSIEHFFSGRVVGTPFFLISTKDGKFYRIDMENNCTEDTVLEQYADHIVDMNSLVVLMDDGTVYDIAVNR